MESISLIIVGLIRELKYSKIKSWNLVKAFCHQPCLISLNWTIWISFHLKYPFASQNFAIFWRCNKWQVWFEHNAWYSSSIAVFRSFVERVSCGVWGSLTLILDSFAFCSQIDFGDQVFPQKWLMHKVEETCWLKRELMVLFW